MPDLPIPSFATFEKLSSWAKEQAIAFGLTLQSPSRYYSEVVVKLPEPLFPSLGFLAFVLAVCTLVTVPIDTIMWKVNVFDAAIFISNIVPLLLSILLFSTLVFWFGRLFGGRGEANYCIAGMFYSSS